MKQTVAVAAAVRRHLNGSLYDQIYNLYILACVKTTVAYIVKEMTPNRSSRFPQARAGCTDLTFARRNEKGTPWDKFSRPDRK